MADYYIQIADLDGKPITATYVSDDALPRAGERIVIRDETYIVAEIVYKLMGGRIRKANMGSNRLEPYEIQVATARQWAVRA